MTATAAGEAAMRAIEQLGGVKPSLAVVFASPHHSSASEDLIAAVHDVVAPEHSIGCVGEAIVGEGREVESSPAMVVWLAAFPKPVEAYRLEFVRTASGGIFAGYRFDAEEPGVHLLLADPFTFPADLLLRHLNDEVPGSILMGGMASGVRGPGEIRLFLDGEVIGDGAVGVRLRGVHVHPLVSQGCRPIGSSFTVTEAEGNVIRELGGRPPLERLQELLLRASAEDRLLVEEGLHVGRAIDEYKAELGRGDFLIRGVVGADPATGALAVGDQVGVGETVRFHVRDAETADEDLRASLDVGLAGAWDPVGGLLFTCNGRGQRLFGVPDHDAGLVAERLPGVPVAGFFCAGEIGPVAGRNFLHGFTASLALFEADGDRTPAHAAG